MNSKMYYGIFKEAEPQRIGTAGTMEMWLQCQNRGISSRYKEQGNEIEQIKKIHFSVLVN